MKQPYKHLINLTLERAKMPILAGLSILVIIYFFHFIGWIIQAFWALF